MALIATYADVKAHRRKLEIPGGFAWRTELLLPSVTEELTAQAFLAEGEPNLVIRPHFHEVDEFQVIISGEGTLGRHALDIHAVHYARAFTPYGPIVVGDNGLGFLTLRSRRDSGAQYLPEFREKLIGTPKRNPWQTIEMPVFSTDDDGLHTFTRIRNEVGLAAFSLTLPPDADRPAPQPSASYGQYLIVTKGALVHEDRCYGAVTVIFVKPDDPAFQLCAGPEGLEMLVLHFPRPI